MTDSFVPKQADLDAELDRILGDTTNHGLRVARDVIEKPDDRWYGELVGVTYTSLSDAPDDELAESLAAAAAAIELLRGYTWLRSQLLSQLTDEPPHFPTAGRQQSLLAGDYLYTSAFEALASMSNPALDNGVGILTTGFKSITEAFARSHPAAESAESDPRSFLDQTLGSLGEAATCLGATLAGDSPAARTQIAAVGSGVATAHGIHRLLETGPRDPVVALRNIDEPTLREHAARRWNEAVDAQEAFRTTADCGEELSLVPDERINTR